MLSPFRMVCGNFILPEPASYVFFYAFSNLRNLLYIIKMVPVVGGIISGGFDFAETKVIANRAYTMFIDGNFDVLSETDIDEIECATDEETLK